MPDKKGTRNKHLTEENRQEIQECLGHGMTFKAIARRIGKDPTTISKEVKKHVVVRPSGGRKTKEDGTILPSPPCSSLLKAPFVCNGCPKYHGSCGFDRHVYIGNKAQDAYKTLLSEARTGIPLTKEAFYRMDQIISDGVKRGQHLYHILHTHSLGVAQSTVYRHLKQGYLSILPVDLPRVVKFKPRACHKADVIPKGLKVGRMYDDFKAYLDQNNIVHWVEMDTLIGRIGGKCILTLHFTVCNFMVGFLLDNKTSAEVARTITSLKALLAEHGLGFSQVFPLLLTDNGGEFADIFAVENNAAGERESRLFFCDPYQANQKPRVEKNHTLFRDIVAGGSSFDELTQEKVDLIFSHVNSVKRHGLSAKTAYEMFSFLFGDALPRILGIRPIPPEEVCQSDDLLNRI